MVAFVVVASSSGELRLAVLVTPGSAGSIRGPLEPRPLDEWRPDRR